MNKEQVKTFSLIILVVINFALGTKILIDKKLWPSGYNFFISLENSELLNVFKRGNDRKLTKTHLTMPQQIIVNTGDQTSRIAVNPNEAIFEDLYNTSNEILPAFLRADSDEIFFAEKNELLSALSRQSLCLNYAVPYETKLFGDFFGLDSSALSEFVKSVSTIIISTDNTVFFEDYDSGHFYKSELKYNSDKLVSVIKKAQSSVVNSSGIINYAADLKFDEAFGLNKAVLSPAVPVYSTTIKKPYLTATNPISSDGIYISREIINEILPIFRINPNTARSYPEVNGTLVFVENNGILKISPDGVLSYQSTDSNGFPLSVGDSYVETLGAVADFTDKVNSSCISSYNLYLSSPLDSNSNTITFDYMSGGIPVNIDIKNFNHAITAEIKNGSLLRYTQVLRSYTPSETLYDAPVYIDALDMAIENYSQSLNRIEIKKMNLIYKDNGLPEPTLPVWHTEAKSIIINKEEF